MTSTSWLAIMLGIWFGMSLYFVTKVIIGTTIKVLADRANAKQEEIRTEQKRANHTGRVIGFRPIEESVRT